MTKMKEIPPPWTEIADSYNFKPRLVMCETCGYEVITALPQPRCSLCNKMLVTVIKHHETGE